MSQWLFHRPSGETTIFTISKNTFILYHVVINSDLMIEGAWPQVVYAAIDLRVIICKYFVMNYKPGKSLQRPFPHKSYSGWSSAAGT